MKFDYSELRGLIISRFKTFSAFSKETGYSREKLSLQLSNKRKMSSEDIYELAGILDIDSADISKYFFTPKV